MENEITSNPPDHFSDLRQRAEAALSSASMPKIGEDSINDVRKLLSELQIHQIELEMQNDELRRAQVQLATEREKYANLYNFAPIAYFTVDRDDVILDLNLAAAELLGLEPRYLIDHPITPYLTPESLQTFVHHREKARAFRTPQICELTVRHRDGTYSIVQARTIALDNSEDSKPLWRSVMTDITVHKRIEAALRESEEKFRSIAEQSTDMIAITNQEGIILYVSHASNTLFGLAAEEMQLHPLTLFLGDPSASNSMFNFHESIKNNHQAMSGEFVMKRKDGSTFIGELNGSYYSFDSQPGTLVIIRDVSERRRAEEELQKSEKRYRDLFTNNHAVMLLVDPETGQVVDANAEACAFYGYSLEELRSMLISDINILSKDQIFQAMQNVKSKRQQQFSFQHRLRNGKIRDVEVYSAPIDVDGKNLFYSIVQDVTEKKQVEDEIQRTRARYYALFEQSHDAVFILDLKGNHLEVNHRAAEMLGYTWDELLSLNTADISAQPDQNEDVLERLMKDENIPPYERFLQRKNGEIIHVEISVELVRDANAEPMHIQKVIRDITERKRSEEALHISEARWQFALEGAGDGVWDWDQQTNRIFYSKQWKAMLGYREDEIGDSLEEWIQRIHPDDQADFQKGITGLLSGEVSTYTSEYRLRSRDGFYKWILARGKTIQWMEDQKPFRVIGTHTDVTERKQAEQITQLRLDLLEHAQSHSMHELLTKALDEIERITDSQISFYHFVESDQNTLSLQAWSTRTLKEFCTAIGREMHYSLDQAGVWVDGVKTQKPVIHNDYGSLPHRKGLPSGHAPLVRELVVPILREDRVVSILGVGNKPTDYHEGDIETVSFIADVTWEIVQRKRAEEGLRNANDQLSRQLLEIEQLQTELKEQALRDPLTSLYNRRYLTETMTREVARCERENTPLSVIIMDVDHFKNINDTYGHQVGDEFLKTIAGLIQKHSRSSDIACRYGGEEFLLLMPGTNLQSAALRAEELRVMCEETSVLFEMKNLNLTISFGVASYPIHGATPDEILIKADRALYQSKRHGRNRVTVWSEQ